VTLKRPEVPPRVEAVVDRALAKDPSARFQTMAELEQELEACLVEVRSGDDQGATGVLPVVKPRRAAHAVPAARRHRRRNVLVAVIAVVAAAAIGAAAFLALRDDSPSHTGGNGGGTAGVVSVSAVSAYDPEGDGSENDGEVPLATDGNPGTAWQTEHYATSAFGNLKSGVGLVVDAGCAVGLESLTITSDSPGYTALIKAGDSRTGPFTDDSSSQVGGTSTKFDLNGTKARYYMIWITNLGPDNQVSVNEVTAR